jgi:hypothetical protein
VPVTLHALYSLLCLTPACRACMLGALPRPTTERIGETQIETDSVALYLELEVASRTVQYIIQSFHAGEN